MLQSTSVPVRPPDFVHLLAQPATVQPPSRCLDACVVVGHRWRLPMPRRRSTRFGVAKVWHQRVASRPTASACIGCPLHRLIDARRGFEQRVAARGGAVRPAALSQAPPPWFHHRPTGDLPLSSGGRLLGACAFWRGSSLVSHDADRWAKEKMNAWRARFLAWSLAWGAYTSATLRCSNAHRLGGRVSGQSRLASTGDVPLEHVGLDGPPSRSQGVAGIRLRVCATVSTAHSRRCISSATAEHLDNAHLFGVPT